MIPCLARQPDEAQQLGDALLLLGLLPASQLEWVGDVVVDSPGPEQVELRKIIPMSVRSGRIALSESWETSVPSTSTRPLVGDSNPLMRRTRVDFPAPECPMTAEMEPLLIARLTSSKARTGPVRV